MNKNNEPPEEPSDDENTNPNNQSDVPSPNVLSSEQKALAALAEERELRVDGQSKHAKEVSRLGSQHKEELELSASTADYLRRENGYLRNSKQRERKEGLEIQKKLSAESGLRRTWIIVLCFVIVALVAWQFGQWAYSKFGDHNREVVRSQTTQTGEHRRGGDL